MRLPPPGFKQPIPDPSEQMMEDSDMRWALLRDVLDEMIRTGKDFPRKVAE